ncbi:MAG: LysR substrate-binding domain-containing protein [Pseudomonadota bacterium]
MQTRLPPLNAVRVFDACARHLNFTRAAEELSVSHSAVSKQIAVLEDFVGERLFDRSGGRVTLTEEGRRLRDVVSPAFSQLERAFIEHRRERPGSRVLRVATVASLAAHVLVPAYAALTSALPDLDLEIATSDRPLDLSREAVDLAIRFGRGSWPGLHATELAPGKLTAVVRPDLTSSYKSLPRLQTFAADEWSHVDRDLRPTGAVIGFEHFVVAIEAARTGTGVGLLPNILVRQLLHSEQLVDLPIADVDWPDTFYVVSHQSSRRQKDVAAFTAALQATL